MTVGIIAFNDFHGNLEPPRQAVLAPDGSGGTVTVPAGGAAWLAGAIDALRRRYTHHLTVSAGDLIGGSPVTSALFLDEPTVEVMNRIGLDYSALGNHEFDRGRAELLRIAHGGCAQFAARPACALRPYRGARFTFLAANTLTESGKPLFAGSALRSFDKGRRKVTIGLIGVTLKETGSLVPRSRNPGLHWVDEAEAANTLAPRLKAAGADVIVLLIHQGGRTGAASPTAPDPNRCDNLSGAIRPILDRLDPSIEIVVSGHTHWAYVCDYPAPGRERPLLLTSAGLYGEQVTELTLTLDTATHRLLHRRAHNVIVQSPAFSAGGALIANTALYPAFRPHSGIASLVRRSAAAASAVAERRVGWLARPVPKMQGPLANTGGALGRLVADSQLAATRAAGAEIAFMNPFGLRAALLTNADGSVSFGQIFAVEPFGNLLVTQTLSGAQIKAILEQGFDADGPEQVLTPSAGFVFQYDRARQVGSRIGSMTLNGAPIEPERSYRVTTSEFLADGGDTFIGFQQGRDSTPGVADVAALEQWLTATPPRQPPEDVREVEFAAAAAPLGN
ncbi:MAG: bifunctional metallophosphatase/5'-nucleotidase [Novosphingobium sp.]